MSSADRFTIEFYQKDNQRLRNRVDELEETVRQLRVQIEGEYALPAGLPHLTGSEKKLLRMLLARRLVSRDGVMLAVYGDKPDQPDPRIIDVWISKLRRKLKPVGIKIETLWGQGWSLTKEGRGAIEALEKGEAA